MATGSNLLSVLAHYNRHPWLNIDDCSCCPAQEFFVKVIEQNAILGATIISITHTNRIWCLDVQRFNRANEQQSNRVMRGTSEFLPFVVKLPSLEVGSLEPGAGFLWFQVLVQWFWFLVNRSSAVACRHSGCRHRRSVYFRPPITWIFPHQITIVFLQYEWKTIYW